MVPRPAAISQPQWQVQCEAADQVNSTGAGLPGTHTAALSVTPQIQAHPPPANSLASPAGLSV